MNPDLLVTQSLPSLELLLSRGVEKPVSERCYEQSLMYHLGYKTPDLYSIPAADCRWAVDFTEMIPEYCVCADPVHLLLNKAQARLMDASALQISCDDAEQLMVTLNKLLAEDGFELHRTSSERWYMSGKDPSSLYTLPVKSIVGRNVGNFLPEGEQSASWNRLMTEVQMLLYTHPINQARTARGLLSVNALWFWGAERLPINRQVTNRPDVGHLFADDVFSLGLAKQIALDSGPLEQFSVISKGRQSLLYINTQGMNHVLYEDINAWNRWIMQLETDIFKPAVECLKSGVIDSVIISVGNAREFTIERGDMKKFWRRKKALKTLLSNEVVALDLNLNSSRVGEQ